MRSRHLPPEDVLVERLAAAFATRRRDVLLGVGDDAAVVSATGPLVAAVDVLVEDEDFRKDQDPRRLGRKALNVNLSDLAAMGATPLWALLALALPRGTDEAWFDALIAGVRDAAAEHDVAVVGGDLSASRLRFAAVTVLGRAPSRGALARSGASPGDLLWVSGTLGAAAAGLACLEAGFRLLPDRRVSAPKGRRLTEARAGELARLIRHQIDPRPAVELGRTLAEGGLASAAIDLSDGLARDLHRLCRASGVGATVERDLLPIDSALDDLARVVRIEPLKAALFGGEDYGLLFAVPRRKAALLGRLSGRFALRQIGRFRETDGKSPVLLSGGGRLVPLPDAGFDHFA